MKGHCCFAGCDLVTCRRCGESYCVRGLHLCETRCPECSHPMSHHAPEGGCGSCIWAAAKQAEARTTEGNEHG